MAYFEPNQPSLVHVPCPIQQKTKWIDTNFENKLPWIYHIKYFDTIGSCKLADSAFFDLIPFFKELQIMSSLKIINTLALGIYQNKVRIRILQVTMLRAKFAELKSEPICYNHLIIILVTLIINFAINLIKRITTFQTKSPIAARSHWRLWHRKIVKIS